MLCVIVFNGCLVDLKNNVGLTVLRLTQNQNLQWVNNENNPKFKNDKKCTELYSNGTFELEFLCSNDNSKALELYYNAILAQLYQG